MFATKMVRVIMPFMNGIVSSPICSTLVCATRVLFRAPSFEISTSLHNYSGRGAMFAIHRNFMTEPAPKRAKMATDDQSASTSTGDTQGVLSPLPMDNADSGNRELSEHKSGGNAKVPEKWFAADEQDFKIIKGVGAFADHTLFLEKLLNRRSPNNTLVYEPVFITAPPRFGKSTNLSMVKYFLEIQCDENGIPIKRPEDLKAPVKDTANYKLFENTKIMQHTNLVEEHFGRHPVIHLDFKGATRISNADDALMHCRTVLHQAYKRHEYLLNEKFDNGGNRFISSWCDRAEYRTFAKDIVLDSLLDLAEFLYRYFKRKVFILVDEYDFIAREIISQCEEVREVKMAIDIYQTMLGNAIKGMDVTNYVQGAILTGVSDIGGADWSQPLNNVLPYRYPEEHKFMEFYGLAESEVRRIARLYARTHTTPNIFEELTNWYNGYETANGRKIYSIWSVGNSLQEGKVCNYWRNTDQFYHFVDMLKIPQIVVYILELLNGKDLAIQLQGKMSVNAIMSLNKKIKATEMPWYNLLFSMMLEDGYLTMLKSSNYYNSVKVRLPNKEIKSEIRDRTTAYFEKAWGLDNTKIVLCAQFFDNVKSFDTQNDDFKAALEQFHENLTKLFKGFSQKKIVQINEDHLHCLIHLISSNTNYRLGTEVPEYKKPKTVGRVDLLLLSPSNDFVIIVTLQCDNTREKGNTGNTNKSSLADLQQILDDKTLYMSTLTQHNIEKYFLIGISIDQEKKPSISCLLNSEDINRAENLPILNTASST